MQFSNFISASMCFCKKYVVRTFMRRLYRPRLNYVQYPILSTVKGPVCAFNPLAFDQVIELLRFPKI